MNPTCTIAVLVAVILMLVPSVTARACNSTELTENAWVSGVFSGNPDCDESTFDLNVNTVKAICAGGCMKLLRELLPSTPDCEFKELNLGESMKQLIVSCDEVNSASASGSESTGESSNPTVDNTTDTAPICSIEDVALIRDLNAEYATNPDCLGSAGKATGAAYCSEDACVAYLTEMEYRLPNCTYGTENVKQVIGDSIAACKDPTKWSNATTSTETETSTTSPTSTTQTPTIPSEDSQASATPAPTKSKASVSSSVTTASALILAIAFTWISL